MDKLEGILGKNPDNRKKNGFEKLKKRTIEALMNYRNILGEGGYGGIDQVDRLIETIEGLEPTPKNQEYLRELLWKMENALGLLKYLDITKKPSEEQYSRGIRGYLGRIGGGIYRRLRGIGGVVYGGLEGLYYKLRRGFEKIGYKMGDLKYYFGRLKEWIGEHKSIVARAIIYPLLIAGAMTSPIFKALLALVLMGDIPLMMLELETKTGEEIKKRR